MCIKINFPCNNNNNAYSIATGYGLDGPGVGVRVPIGAISSPLRVVQTGSGAHQPPIQWIPGALYPGHEADHSPPTSVEFKNTWIYTPTPPYAFIAECLIS
jgi:hypothetical protein